MELLLWAARRAAARRVVVEIAGQVRGLLVVRKLATTRTSASALGGTGPRKLVLEIRWRSRIRAFARNSLRRGIS